LDRELAPPPDAPFTMRSPASAANPRYRRYNVSKSGARPKAAKAAEPGPVKKTVGGSKNGGTRMVEPKGPKYYPADDEKKPKYVRTKAKELTSSKIAKLRGNITPGTVIILLSGRFRGKRVVFLKQLEKSGLLLVTGPFKVNGVPLRRVNQAYVIATSTKVDVSGIDVAKFDDAYFARAKKSGSKDTFAQPAEKPEIDPKRIADQKAIDDKLIAKLGAKPLLKEYLAAPFSLSKGDRPHEMKF